MSMLCRDRADTHPSKGHSSDNTLIRSGLVLASSLYTFQLLASLLSPPCAAVLSANRDTISPESV